LVEFREGNLPILDPYHLPALIVTFDPESRTAAGFLAPPTEILEDGDEDGIGLDVLSLAQGVFSEFQVPAVFQIGQSGHPLFRAAGQAKISHPPTPPEAFEIAAHRLHPRLGRGAGPKGIASAREARFRGTLFGSGQQFVFEFGT
jgi:hypothetical protein